MRKKPAKRLPVPTAAEMRLLQILWELEEGSVEDVLNDIRKSPAPL